MANILYLVHRLPYPPNKGDKVRSYNLLKHLLKQHRVFLGTFIDAPEDAVHIDQLKEWCAGLHVSHLNPRIAKIRSLNGLLAAEPLTLRYFRDAKLQSWVDEVCRQEKIEAIVVFSSAMAQYIEDKRRIPLIVDFVDVDSAKWAQYAPKHRWPLSWIYRREGELLLNYERQLASRAARSFFVTDAEVELFRKLAPECGIRVEAMSNGVDSDYFSPAPDRASPYPAFGRTLVFTGAMDYWPNIDAVIWFAGEVLPPLLARFPDLRFYIVGRTPAPEVQALAGEHVIVTGTVDDVRPYLQYADIVVAPLRVARGIQNKILEAMAMERPVVATSECAAPINARIETELLLAGSVEDFVATILDALSNPDGMTELGKAAREMVVARYSWEAHLKGIDPYLRLPPAVS